MSSQYTNPYTPPRANPELYAPGGDAADGEGTVPDAILEQLRGTKPWVIFMAVIGFIGSGLMMLGGLAVMAMGSLGSGTTKLPGAIGLVYLVLAVIYIFPSLHLLRYGSAITRLIRDPHMERLGVALGHQRSFWKLVGIMTAVIVALYPIGIMVGVAAMLVTRGGR